MAAPRASHVPQPTREHDLTTTTAAAVGVRPAASANARDGRRTLNAALPNPRPLYPPLGYRHPKTGQVAMMKPKFSPPPEKEWVPSPSPSPEPQSPIQPTRNDTQAPINTSTTSKKADGGMSASGESGTTAGDSTKGAGIKSKFAKKKKGVRRKKKVDAVVPEPEPDPKPEPEESSSEEEPWCEQLFFNRVRQKAEPKISARKAALFERDRVQPTAEAVDFKTQESELDDPPPRFAANPVSRAALVTLRVLKDAEGRQRRPGAKSKDDIEVVVPRRIARLPKGARSRRSAHVEKVEVALSVPGTEVNERPIKPLPSKHVGKQNHNDSHAPISTTSPDSSLTPSITVVDSDEVGPRPAPSFASHGVDPTADFARDDHDHEDSDGQSTPALSASLLSPSTSIELSLPFPSVSPATPSLLSLGRSSNPFTALNGSDVSGQVLCGCLMSKLPLREVAALRFINNVKATSTHQNCAFEHMAGEFSMLPLDQLSLETYIRRPHEDRLQWDCLTDERFVIVELKLRDAATVFHASFDYLSILRRETGLPIPQAHHAEVVAVPNDGGARARFKLPITDQAIQMFPRGAVSIVGDTASYKGKVNP